MDTELTKKPTILVVDDEEGALMSVKYALGSDYNVLTSQNMPQTTEIINTQSFDLILLDIFFEKENRGIELLSTLYEKFKTIPIIMVSGSMEWAMRWHELKSLGASGFINKPFDFNKIKNIINKCLNGEEIEHIN